MSSSTIYAPPTNRRVFTLGDWQLAPLSTVYQKKFVQLTEIQHLILFVVADVSPHFLKTAVIWSRVVRLLDEEIRGLSDPRTIHEHVHRLRARLDEQGIPRPLISFKGSKRGYQFDPSVTLPEA